MLCTLDPGSMPEGMRAGGKGVLVYAPPPHRAYIFGKPKAGEPLLIWEP
jgi:hypothetical protein